MDRSMNRLLKFILLLVSGILLFFIFPKIKYVINKTFIFLLPFLLGFVFAFIFNPLVDYLEKKKINRVISSLFILGFLVLVIVLIFVLLVPTIVDEGKKLFANLPSYLENIETIIKNFLLKLRLDISEYEFSTSKILNMLGENKQNIFNFFAKIIQGIFSYIVVFIITPILMLYFLIYYHKITKIVKEYCIRKKKEYVIFILKEIEKTMHAYLKGILLVMVILTIISTLAFSLIGLDLALLWGLIIGLTNIIPYIGPYIGGIIVGIFTLGSAPSKLISVILLIIILQFIESNFITPQVESKTVKINPIIVIFFVTLFGNILGIIGMLIAVPVLSIIHIILKSSNNLKI